MTIFLDLPDPGFDAGARFWQQATGSRLSAPRAGGRFHTLLPGHGDPCLRLQRLDTGEAGCHLDLHLDAGDLPAAVDLAISLGATHRHHEPGLDLLHSPGGHPFCLVPWDGESIVPAPAGFPESIGPNEPTTPPDPAAEPAESGATARLDQLCLDIPPRLWATETAFWGALTGWDLRATDLPELTRIRVPPALPVKLLLQRTDDEAGTVRSHPDLATGDRAALTRRHVALGARVLARTAQWTVLNDPQGRVYCLTDRTP